MRQRDNKVVRRKYGRIDQIAMVVDVGDRLKFMSVKSLQKHTLFGVSLVSPGPPLMFFVFFLC